MSCVTPCIFVEGVCDTCMLFSSMLWSVSIFMFSAHDDCDGGYGWNNSHQFILLSLTVSRWCYCSVQSCKEVLSLNPWTISRKIQGKWLDFVTSLPSNTVLYLQLYLHPFYPKNKVGSHCYNGRNCMMYHIIIPFL